MNQPHPSSYVLVIGGANGEYLIKPEKKIVLGEKHVAGTNSLIGGSGINYSLRLLKAGFWALPILPLGQDSLGEWIQAQLLAETEALQLPDVIRD
ncbi:MAG: hypothetical protein ACFBSC_12805 [Microcoleaceae cyanobacterium]